MSIQSFRDLRVWQEGMQLAADAYRSTQHFPKHEVYGLASQVQRSAVSIPANIAEGHARDSTKEFLRHISIALGSRAELEPHILLAKQFEYLPVGQVDSLLAKLDTVGKMLRGLQKSLKAKLKRPPGHPE